MPADRPEEPLPVRDSDPRRLPRGRAPEADDALARNQGRLEGGRGNINTVDLRDVGKACAACGNGVHLLCQDQLSLGNNDLHSYIAAYEYEAVLGRNLKVLNEEERLAEKEEEIQELEQRAISFELLYAVVMEWNFCYEKESEEDVINNN